MKQTDFEHYSELLQRFYHAFHIPVSIYQGGVLLRSYVAVAIEPDPAALYLKNAFSADEKKHEQKPFYVNHHGISCGMLHISESDYRILVGPVSSVPPTPRQCSDILADTGLPFSQKKSLLHSLKKTPVFDFGRFLSLMQFLDFTVNGNTTSPSDADETEISEPFERKKEDLYEVQHNSFELEKNILYAVEQGRTQNLLGLLLQVTSSHASSGLIGADSLRIVKNSFIVSAALVSRAAIRAGLDYEYALTLTDFYISEMETLKSELDIPPLLGKMMIDFCVHVEELNKPKDCSPLTRAVLDDVSRHLYETLTVADISHRQNMSPTYVSRVFEKDMNLKLKQYILQQKVKEAQWLLIAKELPISDISTQLGFSSQSHFQTAFKNVAGISPGNYRRQFAGRDTVPLSRGECP